MALWFPLMVNSREIGEVAIVRRDDPISDSGEYVYDWTVSRFQTGVTKCAPTIHSGEVTHVYGEGAFELVRKVMEAHCQETSDKRRVASIRA